jgi:hypothetical protein
LSPLAANRRQPEGGEHLVGVISNIHGLLRPQAVAALAGCELIVHAGDVADQLCGDGVTSSPDPDRAEVDREDVERGFGAAADRRGRATDERIGPVCPYQLADEGKRAAPRERA